MVVLVLENVRFKEGSASYAVEVSDVKSVAPILSAYHKSKRHPVW